ncbi:acetyl-CoA synthetase-like protein [Epithele typhae]|uniref:acetyl-CoA synthetase-like protein n=1 Tax=Epithele typhae TaxID=378194 RepID=UPI0020072729|nr:acetyl-CoA synthetase-like protein [Epithele typhae]KAH9927963.1 acetyl-CoA synthetase-like protein [Epithele typhae]
MAEIHGDGSEGLPYIPDDVTIAHFVMDYQHPVRPRWSNDIRPWLIEEATGRQIGSDEIRSRMFGLSNALKIRWNIGYDDPVCVFSPNHVDYPVVMWAVQNLGGIVSTANPTYTADELAHQLEAIRARLVVVHPDVLQVALEAARMIGLSEDAIILFEKAVARPNILDLIESGLKEPQRFTPLSFRPGQAKEKLALLSFSSGTTGRPKAVMISHYSMIANIVMYGEHMRQNRAKTSPDMHFCLPGDVIYGILPFYHAFGMHFVVLMNMVFGTTVVVAPKFSLQQMLDSIQRYRITNLAVVPPQVIAMCKSPITKDYDLSSLRSIVSGAAPLGPEVTDQLAQLLPKCIIGQVYGLTEAATGVVFAAHGLKVPTPGSAGVLVPGVVARVVKADGSLAGFDELGELQVKQPSIALGYFNNPQATAETYVDGWVRTGDEVRINAAKELFVVDRIKELLKVRGLQVAPSELEGHLLDHAAVRDACVVGVPDEYSGDLPVAFVVLAPEAVQGNKGDLKRALMLHVSEHKARHKWLAAVEFVDEIPKNPSGKLLRRVLRDQAKKMLLDGSLKVESSSRRAKL